MAVTIANVEMAAAWDGAEGDHWAANADRYESTSERYRELLVQPSRIGTGDSVLDIGCGTGRSSRDAARIAASGSVLGVDLSSRMLQRAREVATAEALTNVRFEQADAQVHPFPPGQFDVAISSFGAMFFADPVAAFTNVARSLRSDGRIALLAWRELARNEWLAAIRDALSLGRPLPTPAAGAPGPFGLADRHHTERVLKEAGFVDIDLAEVDEPLRFGADADDAFSFVGTLGITRGLTHDLDDASTAAALDALRRTLSKHESNEGVLFDGSAWLITARTSR
jgi:SAM-dependent methyltransferase